MMMMINVMQITHQSGNKFYLQTTFLRTNFNSIQGRNQEFISGVFSPLSLIPFHFPLSLFSFLFLLRFPLQRSGPLKSS